MTKVIFSLNKGLKFVDFLIKIYGNNSHLGILLAGIALILIANNLSNLISHKSDNPANANPTNRE